jgi:Ca2+-binding EF-hand superfamily protein
VVSLSWFITANPGEAHMSEIEDRKAKARLQFDRFDKDGDGVISVAEYRDVMANLGEFPETTVRAIFDRKDANHDGVLTFEEFWDSLNP